MFACVCVCVCVCERERERESVCVCKAKALSFGDDRFSSMKSLVGACVATCSTALGGFMMGLAT